LAVSSKRVDSQQRQPTPADGEHDALEESSEIHEALSLAKRDTGKDERNREQDTGYHPVDRPSALAPSGEAP
jgi:hypothetical protein